MYKYNHSICNTDKTQIHSIKCNDLPIHSIHLSTPFIDPPPFSTSLSTTLQIDIIIMIRVRANETERERER